MRSITTLVVFLIFSIPPQSAWSLPSSTPLSSAGTNAKIIGCAPHTPPLLGGLPPVGRTTGPFRYARNTPDGECALVADVNMKYDAGILKKNMTPSQAKDIVRECMEELGYFEAGVGTKIEDEGSDALCVCQNEVTSVEYECDGNMKGADEGLSWLEKLKDIIGGGYGAGFIAVSKPDPENAGEYLWGHALEVINIYTDYNGKIIVYYRDPNSPQSPRTAVVDPDSAEIIDIYPPEPYGPHIEGTIVEGGYAVINKKLKALLDVIKKIAEGGPAGELMEEYHAEWGYPLSNW